MGAIYMAFPLTEECTEWLDGEGIPYPSVAEPRMPTPRELKTVLLQLEGFKIRFHDEFPPGSWSAFIEASDPAVDDWSRLNIHEYLSDDEPCSFAFSKGFVEVVFAVVKNLTPLCGPMVVCDDSSVWPVVVTPGDSIEDLVHRFENAWPNKA